MSSGVDYNLEIIFLSISFFAFFHLYLLIPLYYIFNIKILFILIKRKNKVATILSTKTLHLVQE